jgi:small subunit ribosomal protein S20
MPIIKSAKKRVRTARKAAVRNTKIKRSLKAALKALAGVKGDKAGEAWRKAQSTLDKAAKKGVLHKNKVARKKRQLAKLAGAKPTAATAKRAGSARKTAAKPAKKPAVKKTTVKKPTAKVVKKIAVRK